LEKGAPLRRELAITFDDGYEDNYLIAAPILKSMGLPATFFIATSFVGTESVAWWDEGQPARRAWMTWGQIQSLSMQGFEIGAHTRSHADLSVLSEENAREEISGSRLDLETKLSVPVDLFAYPYGGEHQITTGIQNLVKASGFRCCCSCYGGVNAQGADPFSLHRVPISSWHQSPHALGFDLAFRRTKVFSCRGVT
jgi:peptidoglycan/xylan/chitin deacetylase (PgdA/CDA1 family)